MRKMAPRVRPSARRMPISLDCSTMLVYMEVLSEKKAMIIVKIVTIWRRKLAKVRKRKEK